MADPDPFFSLTGPEVSRFTKAQFYGHLANSDHLMNVIYADDQLDPMKPHTQRIVGKKFERVSFSKTEVRNIIFRACTFEGCLFIDTKINSCEFHRCKFINTNTHKIEFHKTYIDPRSFRGCLDRRKHQNIGVHLYQSLLRNSRDQDQPEFERDALFLFLRWKRYQSLYEFSKSWESDSRRLWQKIYNLEHIKKIWQWLMAVTWEYMLGNGVRIRYFIGTSILTISFWTAINYAFRVSFGLSKEGSGIQSIYDAFYFSTITMTTVGFGDITPMTGIGKVFVALQGMLGLFMFAMLASMLFRKITP